MSTHNAKGAGGISIVSRSRRGAEMGTIGSRRKWRGRTGMCRGGPPKIATLSLPEFETSRNHSEFNAEALGSGPRNLVSRGSSKKTRHRDVVKPGIALGSGPRDRGFESRLPDHSFLGEEAAVC